MSDTVIRFSGVTFGFGKGKPLFENLSCVLSVGAAPGKIIALMGPSGVGKTTFCQLTLGIHRPQKGTIEFVPAMPNIGMIPQKAVMFDELSVRDNIACLQYSKSLGRTFREEKVPQAAQALGLADVLHNGTPTSALSGGEAQRVMLARIRTVQCDLLVLDEPCSFLDNRVKSVFLDALRVTVTEGGHLALMVTHVWDEARLIADEVIFFHREREEPVSLHIGTPAQASQTPPTIDALYAIYWPSCELVPRKRFSGIEGVLEPQIPDGTEFVGLFSATGQTAKNPLAEALCQHLDKDPGSKPPLMARDPEIEPSRPFTHCVFFGKGGVAMAPRQ